jgi:hypothetical protein
MFNFYEILCAVDSYKEEVATLARNNKPGIPFNIPYFNLRSPGSEIDAGIEATIEYQDGSEYNVYIMKDHPDNFSSQPRQFMYEIIGRFRYV